MKVNFINLDINNSQNPNNINIKQNPFEEINFMAGDNNINMINMNNFNFNMMSNNNNNNNNYHNKPLQNLNFRSQSVSVQQLLDLNQSNLF